MAHLLDVNPLKHNIFNESCLIPHSIKIKNHSFGALKITSKLNVLIP